MASRAEPANSDCVVVRHHRILAVAQPLFRIVLPDPQRYLVRRHDGAGAVLRGPRRSSIADHRSHAPLCNLPANVVEQQYPRSVYSDPVPVGADLVSGPQYGMAYLPLASPVPSVAPTWN